MARPSIWSSGKGTHNQKIPGNPGLTSTVWSCFGNSILEIQACPERRRNHVRDACPWTRREERRREGVGLEGGKPRGRKLFDELGGGRQRTRTSCRFAKPESTHGTIRPGKHHRITTRIAVVLRTNVFGTSLRKREVHETRPRKATAEGTSFRRARRTLNT